MEILAMNVLLPALVKYRTEVGENLVFCYLNQMTNEVIITDDVEGKGELEKTIATYIRSKRGKRVIPPVPSEGFAKIDPKTYTNQE